MIKKLTPFEKNVKKAYFGAFLSPLNLKFNLKHYYPQKEIFILNMGIKC
jgi:hypothetical protein